MHRRQRQNTFDRDISTTASNLPTMVRLTMTPSIVEGLKILDHNSDAKATSEDQIADAPKATIGAFNTDPSLDDPQPGKPITHAQVIDLWKRLSDDDHRGFTLEELLRESQVYISPPPPRPEPSPEYKALMARLRRDEEQRSYERMLKQPSRMQAFSEQFPTALSTAQGFAEVNRPTNKSDEGDDEVTLEDVHRQVMLIFNFMVSIVGVAGTIWVAARWWSTPARLFVTMGGALVVGIAEVAVYSGYIWRMGEAKKQQVKVKEIREVVQSWEVVAQSEVKETETASKEEAILLDRKVEQNVADEGIRRRLKGEI